MKTPKFSLLLLILIIICCSNPSQDNTNELPETQQNGAEIFPMKVGNFWEYDDFEYENDSLIAARKIKIEVIDKIKILWEGNTISVFELRDSTIFSNTALYFLYRHEPDGVYRYGHSVGNNQNYYYKQVLYIKYPVKVGDTWFEDHGDYRDCFTCVSITDTVSIGEKDYECIRIRMGCGTAWYSDFYFTKGIGLLQNISERSDGYYRKKILTNYQIK